MTTLKYICKSFEELSTAELYDILAVRQLVFIVGQQILYADNDYRDQCSLHCWAINQDDTIVAYLRILEPGSKYNEPAIGRVLTLESVRGTGIGKNLMRFGISQVQQRFGSSAIRISAQQYLEEFYLSLGFKTVSEPYLEEGIPHIEMLK